MGEKDVTQKTLEGFNDVFADIVNVLLFGGEQVVEEDSLTNATVISQYKADKKIHGQERDVAKYWKKGKVNIAIYGLENQISRDSDMPLRVISYDGAFYRAQLDDRNEKRGKTRYPVISLVLYFGIRPWRRYRRLHEILQIPDSLEDYVSNYKINVFEIAFLTPEQVHLFKSDFKIVADYFVQKRINKEYKPSTETIKHVKEVLELMSVLTGDIRFEDKINEFRGRGAVNMCDVLDKVQAKGEEIGRAEGKNIILKLMNKLFSEGRLADAQRVTEDNDYCQKLLKEYTLI